MIVAAAVLAGHARRSRSRWAPPACRCGCSSPATGTSSTTGSTAGSRCAGSTTGPTRAGRVGAADDPARARPLLVALAPLLAFFPARRGRAAAALRRPGRCCWCAYGIGRDRARPRRAAAARLGAAGAGRRLAVAAAAEAARGARRRRRWCWRSGRCRCPSPPRSTRERPWWTTAPGTGSGRGKAVTFDWTHRYGPLDWPRDGTTLLNVKSTQPHYWKAETLDTLRRLPLGARRATSDAAARAPGRPEPPPRPTATGTTSSGTAVGRSSFRFTVRSLSTDLLVVGRAPPIGVERRRACRRPPADGTTPASPTPLEQGDSYTVATYVPDPDRGARCAARRGDTSSSLIAYTTIDLPQPGESALRPGRRRRVRGRPEVLVPALGRHGLRRPGGAAARARARRAYGAHVRAGARSVTAGAPTMYDAVKAHRALPRPQLQLQREAAAPRATRSTRSCSTTSSATASSSRARWR